MSDKAYRLVPDGSLIRIEWEGGGQLAKELSGLYTSRREAQFAIDSYEAKKIPSRQAAKGREVKDGTEQKPS